MSFAVGGPGDLGRPVQIDPAFDAEQREKFKLNQFNLMASDMIALNRTVPDYRNAKSLSIHMEPFVIITHLQMSRIDANIRYRSSTAHIDHHRLS
jgi:hypothetical protein